MAGSAALTVATWAISSWPLTGMAAALMAADSAFSAASMPIFICIGLAPAATFLRPSVTIAWASTVAVVVPSPATSSVLVAASLSSCAPMFSNGSVELDVARHGDAVVGHGRRAVLLVEADVAALGPERRADRVRQRVDAALQGAAGVLVVGDELGHAAMCPPSCRRWRVRIAGPLPRRRPCRGGPIVLSAAG